VTINRRSTNNNWLPPSAKGFRVLSLSLSLSHTHTHTHTQMFASPVSLCPFIHNTHTHTHKSNVCLASDHSATLATQILVVLLPLAMT
jgi:hypothetical protein